ncbi:hypothetical protein V1512DRAFT_274914 [Lipomyces arxii]|uniref:uncharacterized protein n=1 Tax=Lipomyces arxii TaxID=56418 RepID=UPI0034CE9580
MEPGFSMPMGSSPAGRRGNMRAIAVFSLLAMGGSLMYLHYRDRPKSARHIFISPTHSSGPRPAMGYSSRYTASSSNNKGTNTIVRNGREVNTGGVHGVTVERSGGGL